MSEEDNLQKYQSVFFLILSLFESYCGLAIFQTCEVKGRLAPGTKSRASPSQQYREFDGYVVSSYGISESMHSGDTGMRDDNYCC